MTAASTTPANQDMTPQELLEWRDLQNAQIMSMAHVWENPEDERWNDLDQYEGDKTKPIDKAAP